MIIDKYKKLLETLLYYADEHHWDGERCGTVINSWDDYYSSGRIYHYDKGQKARDILKELNIKVKRDKYGKLIAGKE